MDFTYKNVIKKYYKKMIYFFFNKLIIYKNTMYIFSQCRPYHISSKFKYMKNKNTY
jgi:hypothetical protein